MTSNFLKVVKQKVEERPNDLEGLLFAAKEFGAPEVRYSKYLNGWRASIELNTTNRHVSADCYSDTKQTPCEAVIDVLKKVKA